MNEQFELRFPEPDETRALEKYFQPVGTLANDSARALEAVQRDALAHPERYYCSVCGNSFACHTMACKTKLEEALASGARQLIAETEDETGILMAHYPEYAISLQDKELESGSLLFFESQAELLADETVQRVVNWNWQAASERTAS